MTRAEIATVLATDMPGWSLVPPNTDAGGGTMKSPDPSRLVVQLDSDPMVKKVVIAADGRIVDLPA